ncbi:hypothetical protein QEG73_08845 [Chitinophagaceae bacterium 26-R-25]|nr:hypothetical protein [Chitinophagaceae bacterium 26-R-25]
MDLIELVYSNIFLKRLFPAGISEPVFIGQINFDVGPRMSVHIHTKQRPAIEIDKWGKWGVDYDIVVIHLHGFCRGLACLKNWKNADYAPLIVTGNAETLTISQRGTNWSIELECESLIFNGCSTYINGAE